MAAFLELKRVSKQYRGGDSEPVKALDDISFAASSGEWIAIMGPSGSGKTTLLNILGCLDQASSGAVLIDGVDTSQLSRSRLARFRAETAGFIFQHFHLIPHLTALENVMLAQYFHSMPDEREARQALERVGVGPRARHLPSQLSGGEQQRVAIARALVNDPRIVLADEPTGNLDAVNQQIVLNLLNDFHSQGRTILMVTHDEHVGRLAGRRIDLDHGRVVDSSIPGTEESREFDAVLEELWTRRESSAHPTAARFSPAQFHELVNAMCRLGLVNPCDGVVRFTSAGESRARSVIRRRRLAERLFTDLLAMDQDGASAFNTAVREHILSEEATDRVCAFLGHPPACPHGSPIPHGECCLGARADLLLHRAVLTG